MVQGVSRQVIVVRSPDPRLFDMKRRLAGALALLFALNIAIITLAQSAQAATYRMAACSSRPFLL